MAAETGKRVLVIAPHALDEALGCGGTMARHAQAGDQVETFVLFGDGSGADAIRREAALQAAALLGTRQPSFAGFAENQADRVPLSGLIAAIEGAIRHHRPETIYVPWGGGLHNDHRIAAQAAMTAARPLPGSPIARVYAFEILSSTEWAPGALFRPTRFVAIAETLNAKMAAIAAYAADARLSPHARSFEACRALATLRGASVGVAAAEAFETVREILREAQASDVP